MDLLSVRLTINYKDKPPVLDDLCLDLHPRRSVGTGGAQRLRKKFIGAGDTRTAQPEGRQGTWFDSVGRARVIGAERKRMAQAARQSDFLCAAKPNVGVESGVAVGHTDERSLEAAWPGRQRLHGRVRVSGAAEMLVCQRRKSSCGAILQRSALARRNGC